QILKELCCRTVMSLHMILLIYLQPLTIFCWNIK
uniref:Uncharacterized protein n=1 Tax=Solanum lycopersicum TaxID=4081 RepID=A0A3Q7GBR1_SOLLC